MSDQQLWQKWQIRSGLQPYGLFMTRWPPGSWDGRAPSRPTSIRWRRWDLPEFANASASASCAVAYRQDRIGYTPGSGQRGAAQDTDNAAEPGAVDGAARACCGGIVALRSSLRDVDVRRGLPGLRRRRHQGTGLRIVLRDVHSWRSSPRVGTRRRRERRHAGTRRRSLHLSLPSQIRHPSTASKPHVAD
jgi:hypothetical protein